MPPFFLAVAKPSPPPVPPDAAQESNIFSPLVRPQPPSVSPPTTLFFVIPLARGYKAPLFFFFFFAPPPPKDGLIDSPVPLTPVSNPPPKTGDKKFPTFPQFPFSLNPPDFFPGYFF